MTLTPSRIRHTVVFTPRHAAGSPEETDFLAAAESLAEIPGVEAFEILRETSPKNGYRFGISMEFAGADAYAAYNDHPDHARFVQDRWLRRGRGLPRDRLRCLTPVRFGALFRRRSHVGRSAFREAARARRRERGGRAARDGLHVHRRPDLASGRLPPLLRHAGRRPAEVHARPGSRGGDAAELQVQRDDARRRTSTCSSASTSRARSGASGATARASCSPTTTRAST